MKTAAYCRYSSSNQREASIEDQIRHAQELCRRHGFGEPIIYQDSAISGQRTDRPAYNNLLNDAEAGAFEVLVLWDIKRLSRAEDLPQTLACLQFWKIRVITCDGFDSAQDGSDMRAWLEGLMGNRYNKELAKNTHRGLTGQALAGYSAGGLPYGYRSVHDGDGFKRVVDEDQAAWVRYIFERYAAGRSPQAIAKDLTRRGVKPPRGTSWSMSAIYGDLKRGTGILSNPLYIGQQVWNRSKWIKDPSDKNKRKRFPRPESEWILTEDESMRIIDQQLWNAVKARQKAIRAQTAKVQAIAGRNARGGRGPGHLFSGLLKCGVCGGNFVVVNKYQYGCSQRKIRGNCTNYMHVSKLIVERVLLAGIRQDLLSESAYKAFETEARRLLKASRPDPKAARQDMDSAQKEIDNLVAALRAGISSISVKAALEDAETRLQKAKERLAEVESFQPTQILPRAREVYRKTVDDLSQLDDIPLARERIKAVLGESIRIVPERGILVAELKGGIAALSKINVVAGAGFETYLSSVTRLPLIQTGAIVTARNRSGK